MKFFYGSSICSMVYLAPNVSSLLYYDEMSLELWGQILRFSIFIEIVWWKRHRLFDTIYAAVPSIWVFLPEIVFDIVVCLLVQNSCESSPGSEMALKSKNRSCLFLWGQSSWLSLNWYRRSPTNFLQTMLMPFEPSTHKGKTKKHSRVAFAMIVT